MDIDNRVEIQVGNKNIQAVFADGDLWFSQPCLSVLLETTTQNVNLHLAKLLPRMGAKRSSKYFPVSQPEGSRRVTRKILHFDFEFVHAIAIRTQRFVELNAIVDVAARFGVLKKHYKIIPIQERDFADALTKSLKGIAHIQCQVQVLGCRVDFVLPEYDLAIEYDEPHHLKLSQRKHDIKRQKLLSSKLGWKFIRVCQGKELQGINRVFRHILSREKSVRTKVQLRNR